MSIDPFRKLKFYTYDEVVIHNKQDDFWVVVHRNIFDLSPLIEDRKDSWNVVCIWNFQLLFIENTPVEYGLPSSLWWKRSYLLFH